MKYKINIVTTTPYTITLDDDIVFVNVPGPASIRLPNIRGNHNYSFYIKDYSGLARENPITITAPVARTIDGVSFAILNGGYSHLQVVYDGTNWKTIA